MTPENKTNLLGFIIYMLIVVIGVLGLLLASPHVPAKATDSPVERQTVTQDPNYVQNPYEAQERLKAQGFYKGKVDGIWGKETDKAYCDYCAVNEFKEYER